MRCLGVTRDKACTTSHEHLLSSMSVPILPITCQRKRNRDGDCHGHVCKKQSTQGAELPQSHHQHHRQQQHQHRTSGAP